MVIFAKTSIVFETKQNPLRKIKGNYMRVHKNMKPSFRERLNQLWFKPVEKLKKEDLHVLKLGLFFNLIPPSIDVYNDKRWKKWLKEVEDLIEEKEGEST